MINPDLMRSYHQYKRHEELGHMRINKAQKMMLVGTFFVLIPLIMMQGFFKVLPKRRRYRIHVLFFADQEPYETLRKVLSQMENSKIIVFPKSFFVFPLIMLLDFLHALLKKPAWTLKNLDFFGALALRISKYYGFKLRYNIDRLLLFQEYSFYSSYLTRVFESENGKLYNLMHGVPGKEACYFRFSKCFVWGEYFKKFYIKNFANKDQFIIVGSIYHKRLRQEQVCKQENYDIVYALQGDMYSDEEYTEFMLQILAKIQQKERLKIAVKPHPIYHNTTNIPSGISIQNLSSIESIYCTKMVISHFSTMLLDAKIIGKKVLAFLPKDKVELVEYLQKNEVVYNKKKLYSSIMENWNTQKNLQSLEYIIDLNINTLEVLNNEIL
jgi:hypothetical protein